MANSGGASELADELGNSSPGCSVICGPVWDSVAEGLGRYIDCWLDVVPSSPSSPSPSTELPASAAPLTSSPTTTPTPTRATSPAMIG